MREQIFMTSSAGGVISPPFFLGRFLSACSRRPNATQLSFVDETQNIDKCAKFI